MERLWAETWVLQRRVEREHAVFGDGACWLDYRLYLCRMYGFFAPLEAELAEVPGLADAVPDAGERIHKTALLGRDLLALGVERGHLGQIPRLAVPLLDELPEALGWMYVAESVTLDGAELARHLEVQMPAELDGAAAYLRCYGEDVQERWRRFGAAIDAYVERAGAAACDRIVHAATDCLFQLHRWLAPSSSVSPARAGRVVA